MEWHEVFFGVLLVVGLLALSVYFGWRQVVSLRRLREESMSDDERRYERRKAYSRLVSCGLTLVMAALLAGLLASYDSTFGYAEREIKARKEVDPSAKPTDEEKFLVKVWIGQWIAVLLVLLVVLILAAIDLWATRRFGLRQYRKIADDRRAMIQGEVNRMRGERNGRG